MVILTGINAGVRIIVLIVANSGQDAHRPSSPRWPVASNSFTAKSIGGVMRLVCQVHFSAVFLYFCCLPELRVMQTGMTVQVALRL